MRGRDKTNPNHRGKANENYEQRLEINPDGTSNTITTVQKDNMVLETKSVKLGNAAQSNQRYAVYDENGLSPAIQVACGTGGGNMPMFLEREPLKIKQATAQGYVECDIGGVADLNYISSKTRRGRVQERGNVCPTLATENVPSVLEDWTWEINGEKYLIRIRKLTARECWRLMGFDDEDFDKAERVNSNTQLYKQAGNSIVEDVLCEIFKQML